MKRYILIALMVVAALVVATRVNYVHSQNAANVERTIIRMEQDIATALSMSDPDELQTLLADDFVVWNDDGSSYTKSQLLSDLRSRVIIYNSYDNFNLKVKVFGDTAVVVGQNAQSATRKGQQYNSRGSFTRIYAKRQGVWQSVILRWGCQF